MSPLSLLTFFAAAKKVSAAPHRGDSEFVRQIAQSLAAQDLRRLYQADLSGRKADSRLLRDYLRAFSARGHLIAVKTTAQKTVAYDMYFPTRFEGGNDPVRLYRSRP